MIYMMGPSETKHGHCGVNQHLILVILSLCVSLSKIWFQRFFSGCLVEFGEPTTSIYNENKAIPYHYQ